MEPKPETDLFAPGTAPVAGKTDLAPTRAGPSPTATFTGTPDQIGDFLVLRELGRGSFARVYLAHHVGLDRRVALKVTDGPARGEGRTLAGLDHQHIVKVFDEFDDPAAGRGVLVLQYVPGTTLANVLAELAAGGNRPSKGEAILAAIDQLSAGEVEFDPAALRDREVYRRGGFAATVCRLGASLADALACAHARGVLHCDIKPANILISPYGRPLLADFNVAVAAPGPDEPPRSVGGTLMYMAPEHHATVFGRPGHAMDHRADLYSLAVVVLEAVAGRLLRMPPEGRTTPPDEWAAELVPLIPPPVWQVLRRCLAHDPAGRYADGTELAAALRRAADMADAADGPAHGTLARAVHRHPTRMLLALTFVPHLLGSLVNIGYNAAEITLNPVQAAAFDRATLWYNLLVYPACLAAVAWAIRPLALAFRHPDRVPDLPAADLDRLRRRAVSLGRWGAVLSLVGWVPGGVVFPVVVGMAGGSLDAAVFGHFALSFTLSGLVALAYSCLGIQFAVLYGFYPRLVHPDVGTAELRRELAGVVRWLGAVHFLAALVPLSAAVLQVTLAPSAATPWFRFLVTGLIVNGMVGLWITAETVRHLKALAEHFTRPGVEH